jgi:hypothetical protein
LQVAGDEAQVWALADGDDVVDLGGDPMIYWECGAFLAALAERVDREDERAEAVPDGIVAAL